MTQLVNAGVNIYYSYFHFIYKFALSSYPRKYGLGLGIRFLFINLIESFIDQLDPRPLRVLHTLVSTSTDRKLTVNHRQSLD